MLKAGTDVRSDGRRAGYRRHQYPDCQGEPRMIELTDRSSSHRYDTGLNSPLHPLIACRSPIIKVSVAWGEEVEGRGLSFRSLPSQSAFDCASAAASPLARGTRLRRHCADHY